MNYKVGFYFKLSLLFALLSLLFLPLASSLATREKIVSLLPFISINFRTNAQDAQDAQGKSKGQGRKLSYMHKPPEAISIVNFSGENSDNWLEDFELEIKNKSDKPIYYLLAILELPELKRNDLRFAFDLVFGEQELYDSNKRPSNLEKSPHLQPGETITLKISEKQREHFNEYVEQLLKEGHIQTDVITRLVLGINLVRYADGTGYHGPRKLGPQKISYKTLQDSSSRGSPASPNSGCKWWNTYISPPAYCVPGQPTLCTFEGGSETSFPGPLDEYGIGAFFENTNCPGVLPSACSNFRVIPCPAGGSCNSPNVAPYKECQNGKCVEIAGCGLSTCGNGQTCNCDSGYDRPYRKCQGADGSTGNCGEVNDGTCRVSTCTEGASCQVPCPSGTKKNYLACQNGTCRIVTTGCGKDESSCAGKPSGFTCALPTPTPVPIASSCGYFERCYYSSGGFCSQDGFVVAEADCCCPSASPLIIDLDGNGYQFTSAPNGVLFDIGGNGKFFRVAWPTASSADGWLALDRNSNGTIDGGKELFGNFTQQNGDPNNIPPNGFIALRWFDDPAHDGNGDGVIDHWDNVYNSLRIWVDANHNGISEANELRTMQAAGVDNIDLANYYASSLTDQWGNLFKYKSQAWAGGWKTICDVFPAVQSLHTTPLFSQYDPIKVCDGTGLGTTMLGWYAPGVTNTQIRIGSPTGTLFAQGGSSGRAQTGKWVVNGQVFYLIDASNGATLGTYTAVLTAWAACPNFAGYVDQADCNTISGWVADRNQLNTSIDVWLYDGVTPLATVTANQLRSDVGAYLGDNGLHGFSIATPASLRDGGTHSITMKFPDWTTTLGNTPRTISCPPIYEGVVDQINCGLISGWAANRNQPNTPIQVMLYKGNTYVMTILADQLRGDVGAYLGDNGMHGFSIPTPATFKGGSTNTVHVKFVNGSQLGNSPRYNMTCN